MPDNNKHPKYLKLFTTPKKRTRFPIPKVTLEKQVEFLKRGGEIIVRETYPLRDNKSVTTSVRRPNYNYSILNLKSFQNYKGEWLNFSVDPEKPDQLFVAIRGGVHRVSFKISISDVRNLARLWQYTMLDLFGFVPRFKSRKETSRDIGKRLFGKAYDRRMRKNQYV